MYESSLDYELQIAELKAAIKKKNQLKRNLLNDQERCLSILAKQNQAELLRINFNALKKGLSKIDLIDYYQDPPEKITLDLDPRFSPQAWLEKLFNALKKAKRGLIYIEPHLSQVEQDLSDLEQQLAALLLLKPEVLEPGNLAPKPTPKKKRRKIEPRLPYRIYQSIDGIALWVGKSARDNDELTLRHTRGNEWWVHARGVSGSHVIIKSSHEAPKVETLLDAATLAAHHSKLKHESHPELSYTRVKYVKKAKGMPPGAVLISQEKTLRLNMEIERLERLLKSAV